MEGRREGRKVSSSKSSRAILSFGFQRPPRAHLEKSRKMAPLILTIVRHGESTVSLGSDPRFETAGGSEGRKERDDVELESSLPSFPFVPSES